LGSSLVINHMSIFQSTIRSIFEQTDSPESALREIKNDLKEHLEDDGDLDQFIWDVPDSELEAAYPNIWSDWFGDPKEFRGVVYHQTEGSNLESIKADGLKPMNRTRGFTNKYTGAAVFTSIEPDHMESYGDKTIEIDLELARKLNPDIETQLEEPILEMERRKLLATELGSDPDLFNNSESDGVVDTTLIVYGHIPVKALTL
jgi:hypothetical protein